MLPDSSNAQILNVNKSHRHARCLIQTIDSRANKIVADSSEADDPSTKFFKHERSVGGEGVSVVQKLTADSLARQSETPQSWSAKS